MPMLTQSPSAVPSTHVRTWSMAAFAADAALDRPRASMMAAPRFWTVGMKSFSSQAWSSMTSAAPLPPTLAWNRSGYWVAEWFPQTVMLVTSWTGTPALMATGGGAWLGSWLVMVVKRSRGWSGGVCVALRAAG